MGPGFVLGEAELAPCLTEFLQMEGSVKLYLLRSLLNIHRPSLAQQPCPTGLTPDTLDRADP